MAQLMRASSSGLCFVERQKFKPCLTRYFLSISFTIFQILRTSRLWLLAWIRKIGLGFHTQNKKKKITILDFVL